MPKPTRIFASLLAAALFSLPAAAEDVVDPVEAAVEPAAPAESGDGESSDPGAEGTVAEDVKKDEDAPFPLHMSAGLGNYLGSGTYVGGYEGNPYVASSLTLAPSAVFGDFSLSASQGFDMEWTQSDMTTYANQLMWGDTMLRVGYSGLRFSDIGLGFSFSGGATLPISLASQQVGKITNTGASARMSWSHSDWGIGTFVGTSVNFNWLLTGLASRAANDPVRPFADHMGNVVTPSGCLRREAQDLGNLACAYIPRGLGYGVNTGASWTTLKGQLTFSGSLGFNQSFSAMWGPDDEFTAAQPGVQTGLMGNNGATSGTITASYTPVQWFTLSAGTASFQPLLTADQRLPRFPLWDFVSPANNFSSFFVDTTVSF
jgi:hypothetical protein